LIQVFKIQIIKEADTNQNRKHLRRLVKVMYAVPDFPALDEYGSMIFGRPVRGTWKLFRYVARNSVAADIWIWRHDREEVNYPSKIKVPTFEEFATIMLHEVTHGWCYFLKDNPLSQNYPTGIDEERVCWDVSKLTCEMLGISYQEDLANLCHQVHLLAQTPDFIGF